MAQSPDLGSASSGPSESAYLKLIGQRIRAARVDQNLTQKALGALAGVHDVHVSRLEAGTLDTRILTLRKVADALQVPLEDLVRG